MICHSFKGTPSVLAILLSLWLWLLFPCHAVQQLEAPKDQEKVLSKDDLVNEPSSWQHAPLQQDLPSPRKPSSNFTPLLESHLRHHDHGVENFQHQTYAYHVEEEKQSPHRSSGGQVEQANVVSIFFRTANASSAET